MRVLIRIVAGLTLVHGIYGESHLAAEEPTRLQEARLDTPQLKDWGTRKFLYYSKRSDTREPLGSISMQTDVKDDQVVLHDVWKLKWRGKSITLDLKIECAADNLLRPTKIESVGSGDDEVGTFSIEFNEQRGIVQMEDGETREIKFPDDTLTDAALFRLFTLLPRQQGKEFHFANFLEVSELNLKGPAILRCEGLEKITLHEESVELHKFVYERKDRQIAEAWVDDDGRLRQVRMDGSKLLIEEKTDDD